MLPCGLPSTGLIMIGIHRRGSLNAGSTQLKRPEPPLDAWISYSRKWVDASSSVRNCAGVGIGITDARANGRSVPMPSSAAATRASVTLPRSVPATKASAGSTDSTWSRTLCARRGMLSSSQPPTHTATRASGGGGGGGDGGSGGGGGGDGGARN